MPHHFTSRLRSLQTAANTDFCYVHSGVFRMCERRGPRWSWGRKSPSGVQGQSPGRGSGGVPQKLTLFCYWMPKFWCCRRKNTKTAKNIKIKNYGRLKGGGRRKTPPLNTPLYAYEVNFTTTLTKPCAQSAQHLLSISGHPDFIKFYII